MHARRLTAVAAYLAIGVVLACSDSVAPIAPRPMSAVSEAPTKGGKLKPNSTQNGATVHHVKVLRWQGAGLRQNISAYAYIGKDGGKITLPELNVTFTVPAGALSTTTKITITAVAGHYVVFAGSPAGTHFATPAIMTVDLTKTNAVKNKNFAKLLVGGYIPSISVIGSDDTANDTEDYPATTNDLVTSASFPVPHFSVVILASQTKCPSCNTTATAPPQ
jgi:hypothetical protein